MDPPPESEWDDSSGAAGCLLVADFAFVTEA